MSRLATLEQLLALDPNDTFVLYGVAQEHAKAGSHEQAVAFYDRCLAADPQYLYAYFHKARSLDAMGRATDVVATLKLGIAAAKQAADAKALAELSALLDEHTP